MTAPQDHQENENVTVYITAETEGKGPFWAILAMTPDRYIAYIESMESGKELALGDLGTILESGWGKHPSQEALAGYIEKYSDIKHLEHLLQ